MWQASVPSFGVFTPEVFHIASSKNPRIGNTGCFIIAHNLVCLSPFRIYQNMGGRNVGDAEASVGVAKPSRATLQKCRFGVHVWRGRVNLSEDDIEIDVVILPGEVVIKGIRRFAGSAPLGAGGEPQRLWVFSAAKGVERDLFTDAVFEGDVSDVVAQPLTIAFRDAVGLGVAGGGYGDDTRFNHRADGALGHAPFGTKSSQVSGVHIDFEKAQVIERYPNFRLIGEAQLFNGDGSGRGKVCFFTEGGLAL